MLNTGVGDAKLGASDRRETDERANLDVVGPNAVSGAMERMAALDSQHIRTYALDPAAKRDEKAGEILDVGLGCGVALVRNPFRGDGSRERILGTSDARLVEENIGATEPLRAQLVGLAEVESRPELLER